MAAVVPPHVQLCAAFVWLWYVQSNAPDGVLCGAGGQATGVACLLTGPTGGSQGVPHPCGQTLRRAAVIPQACHLGAPGPRGGEAREDGVFKRLPDRNEAVRPRAVGRPAVCVRCVVVLVAPVVGGRTCSSCFWGCCAISCQFGRLPRGSGACPGTAHRPGLPCSGAPLRLQRQ